MRKEIRRDKKGNMQHIRGKVSHNAASHTVISACIYLFIYLFIWWGEGGRAKQDAGKPGRGTGWVRGGCGVLWDMRCSC